MYLTFKKWKTILIEKNLLDFVKNQNLSTFWKRYFSNARISLDVFIL